MSITDPIADMLTRIRNANAAGHESTEVDMSKMNLEIVKILQSEGFIKSYEIVKGQTHDLIKVHLKYGPRKEKVITNLKRVSKPGLRIYAKKGEIPRVLGSLGIAIISTSKGIMTDREARRLGVGGEVLCYVW
ncbi:MAG: 30S ribosomal protein S8 [Armatimonadetes bacterium]|nr:30S ribosomal protein S8 [Armatimonadota bacterium]